MGPADLRPHRVLLLSALSAALGVGCYSKSDGERLAREAAERERRLVALEEGIEQERAQIREALDDAQTKVTELEQVLERATEVVTRNSADLGTEVHELREQLQVLQGQIAEVRNEVQGTQRALAEQQQQLDGRIQQFARKAGVDMPIDASQVPEDRAEHYAAAEQAFEQGQHSRARALFREYVSRYEEDEKADDAQYWIGKSYLEQERPASALSEFRRVITNYRRGDIVPRALFDMADAFYQLHACTDARSSLEALIQSYPRSSLVRQARQKLRQVRRAPRGYCTS
ncbi:MAG TPA: tetratricopeptide repeat protein [Polyangiaceae bacterium LLY-WYZ-15_(1-7)]|nr:hypothetical protein [Myxococcales bacterium]MAT29482.1 hypothetical protein [Sandaracinus sp.]HJL05094.1 tetratricopeptide repeat protein [Polyangiaceae bacterium LLY-WYZ-15_(1-7)]MBJ70640.1 hypothetical protein [Sandaracinus sp.]HJL10593.1 tetratricopeptide repeat protein [Polyangiaceae bacterium LLY-WYZ-15_(1-7)]